MKDKETQKVSFYAIFFVCNHIACFLRTTQYNWLRNVARFARLVFPGLKIRQCFRVQPIMWFDLSIIQSIRKRSREFIALLGTTKAQSGIISPD